MNLEFEFIKLIHDSGGRANTQIMLDFKDKILAKPQQELRGKIKRMRISKKTPMTTLDYGYNNAIDSVLSLLEPVEK